MKIEKFRPCGIIAILTDFGLEDPYVAAMKAVALDICPQARLVDVVHTVNSFDIETAAFILYTVYKYFPRGTIFVSVVDPGVGSSRKAIAILTKNYMFIGPDNGLLIPAAKNEDIISVHLIENEKYFRKPVSKSFHGRDIFIPVAAHIVCGANIEDIGREIDIQPLVSLDIGINYFEKIDECIKLKVLHIDKFGNIMLSTSLNKIKQILDLEEREATIVLKNRDKKYEIRIAEVFSILPKGTLTLYENSFGFAEIAVNQESAQRILKINRGDIVQICR